MKLALPVPSFVLVVNAIVGAANVFHTTPFSVILMPVIVCPPDEADVLVIEDAATVVVTVGAAM